MEPVEVRIRDCTCEGEPHPDGDVVYLRPTLPLAGGVEAEHDLLESIRRYPLAENAKADEVDHVSNLRAGYLRPRWYETFVRHGVTGWNAEEPFDVDALLEDYAIARPVADKATDLYSPSVLAPFQSPPPKHSRNGRTAGGIRPPSTPTPLRSRRSSPRASGDGSKSGEAMLG